MKKIISIVFLAALTGTLAFAQQRHHGKKDGEGWREKVRAEQVAFITSELDLTEAEAQAFWPVYNDVQKQRREAFQAVHEAYKALEGGLMEGADAAALLDGYLEAKAACNRIETESVGRYKAVLPMEKVAKLLLSEEKFRHQQIGKLQKGDGPRPEGRGRWKEAPVMEN